MITVDLIDKYRKLKNKYTHSLVIIKSSCFFMAFNNDAKIIAHLLNYKIKQVSNYSIVYISPSKSNILKQELKKAKLAYIIVSINGAYISRRNNLTSKNYEKIKNETLKFYALIRM